MKQIDKYYNEKLCRFMVEDGKVYIATIDALNCLGYSDPSVANFRFKKEYGGEYEIEVFDVDIYESLKSSKFVRKRTIKCSFIDTQNFLKIAFKKPKIYSNYFIHWVEVTSREISIGLEQSSDADEIVRCDDYKEPLGIVEQKIKEAVDEFFAKIQEIREEYQ